MQMTSLNQLYEIPGKLETMHNLWSLVYTTIPASQSLLKFPKRLLLFRAKFCSSIGHATWGVAFCDVFRRPFVVLSANLFKESGSIASCYLLPALCALFVLLLSIVQRCRSKPRAPGSTKPLQALSSVLIPVHSPWPSDYARLLTHKAFPRSRLISINISDLICNVCTGAVELKGPRDLALLIEQELCVYGWRCGIRIDLFLLNRVMRWILSSQLPSFKRGLLPQARRVDSAIDLMISTGPLSAAFQLPTFVVDIDFVPHACLQSAIATYLSTLESNTWLIINLTTGALVTSFLSREFLLSSLPFMPRQHLGAHSSALPCRGLGPLLTSLHQLIELISQHQVTIKAIENVSKAREKDLWALEQQLVDDRALRILTINTYGVDGWREHRFLTAWEAALLSTGHLTRWSVIIRR